MYNFRSALKELVYLIYPEYCLACDKEAAAKNHFFCIPCLTDLAFTNHFEIENHDLKLRFLHRQNIEFSAALFNMFPKGKINQLLHKYKYKGKREIGFKLGQMFANKMQEHLSDLDIDLIIPVPLHPKKLRKRAYNQSEIFGKAIAESLDVPIRTDILIKHKETDSQTRKGRQERINNVLEGFTIEQSDDIQSKHILLVDDVVTTGATLEACMMKMSQFADVRFSIAIIALTKH